MPAHAEPQTIGGWRTTDPLGAGGMGTVFRAEHAADRRVAALKIARVDDAIAIDSVRREVALLGRIRHPGVVALVDHGLFERRPWYAMELVEGPSLADHIDALWGSARGDRNLEAAPDERATWVTRPMRGVTNPPGEPIVTRPGAAVDAAKNEVGTAAPVAAGPRPVVAGGKLKETLQLFVSLCQTLGYLHGEGIVHLDLKPTNILLRHGDQPVVVDFGITRQIAGGLNREVLHVDALQGGTDHYMAPEQVSSGLTDARTDLYALGCILFEAPRCASNT
jgi:serine/threonine protein kinase